MMLAGPNQYGNGQGFMQGPMQGGTMPPQGAPQNDGGQMMQQNMPLGREKTLNRLPRGGYPRQQ